MLTRYRWLALGAVIVTSALLVGTGKLGCSESTHHNTGPSTQDADTTTTNDTKVPEEDTNIPNDIKVPEEDTSIPSDSEKPQSEVTDTPEAIPPTIPTKRLDFVPWIEAIVAAFSGPGSEGFSVPTTADLNAFAILADAMLAEDWAGAQEAALAVNYELFQIQDTQAAGDLVYGAGPTSGNTDGRGWFFVRPKALAQRPLVIEAPHTVFDSRTGVLSAEIFRATRPRVLFLAGTHRCANGAESGCSGKTGVCGTPSAPYKESDMAHTPVAYFQIFHQRAMLLASDPLTALQMHGFSSKDTDPEFTFSNGTTTDVDSALSNTLAVALENKLTATTSGKPGNSCNRDGNINRLCGTTNVQGRFTNGVDPAMVCTTAASKSADRFVHMELSYDLRHPGGTLEPALVIEAIEAVFP